ncbi:MAG: tetratricopeptide repeat protein [Rubrivivax sp.]
MKRPTRSRRLAALSATVAVAAWLGGCATPPKDAATAPASAPGPQAAPAVPRPAEPAPAPPAEAQGPAGPASAQQAQRQALAAAELLEVGNEEQALAEIQRALQSDPANRLAQSLLKQIQTDPQTLLGREYFMYRVEPGQSLSRIAGRFLNDVHLFYALARYNDIKVPRQLQGGQMIKVPGKQPPPAAAPAPPVAPPPPPAATVAPPPPPVAPAPVRPADTRSNEAVVAQEYRRGLALMAQQKPAEAVEAFDKVLERDPAHANAKLKRAQAVTQVAGLIRLYDNTIRQLDDELAKNPGNAASKAKRDKAVADRERLLTIK